MCTRNPKAEIQHHGKKNHRYALLIYKKEKNQTAKHTLC
jgi:hypothetical protein